MPRFYATFSTAMWDDDEEFRGLSPSAKACYFMLTTQSDIEACGSLNLTLRRWAMYLCGGDRQVLNDLLLELARGRFILVDAETEELLVRTFVKWDGGYKHAVRVKAVVASAEAIRSPRLRVAIAVELDRLGVRTGIVVPPDDPDPSGTRVPVESLSSGTGEALESHPSAPVSPDVAEDGLSTGLSTEEAVESHSSATPVAVESQRSVVKKRNHKNTPHSTNHNRGPLALASNRPPPPKPSKYCPQHPDGADGPCGPCADAKRRLTRWETTQAEQHRREAAARAAARANCPHCDNNGLTHGDHPTRCTHPIGATA